MSAEILSTVEVSRECEKSIFARENRERAASLPQNQGGNSAECPAAPAAVPIPDVCYFCGEPTLPCEQRHHWRCVQEEMAHAEWEAAGD